MLDEVLQGVADAEVGGDDVAGLHPAEDPGDGAEVFHAARRAELASVRLAGREPMRACLEFGDGRGLLEVGEGVGVVDDVLAVEGVGDGGELVEGGFPLGEDFAGELGDVGGRLLVAGCWLLAGGGLLMLQEWRRGGRGRRARRRS